MVAEGVKSAPVVMELAQRHGVDMPLVREVFDVVQGRGNARRAFRGLLRTAAGAESEAG
jgi:glycerol-3-phosphate dehydrogenase (NAD(P)+)